MLTREKSKIVKGIAILFMVALHVVTFAGSWFDEYIILGCPLYYYVHASLKICVALYAFLTGYAYFFAKDKTISYSIKRICNLLSTYWFILLAIFLPLSLWGGAII